MNPEQAFSERMKSLLDYNPDTGEFLWRVSRGKMSAGDKAGCWSRGYRRIFVDGTLYFAHRLAFLIMEGRWPDPFIDHIDMDKSNNRWSNLREATHSENHYNNAMKGYYFDKNRGKYSAYTNINGKSFHIGRFETRDEARLAHLKTKKEQGLLLRDELNEEMESLNACLDAIETI